MSFAKNLAVQNVRNGLGIIAKRRFSAGATICRIKGEVVTGETVWSYWDAEPRRGENCFRYDADHYLDPEGEIGAFANHSCNPNAGIVKTGRRLMLQAIRPIAAGEEITHDYSTLLGADDVWKMKCNCGETDCRKVVRSFGKLPAAVLRRYRRLGIIPDYILKTGR